MLVIFHNDKTLQGNLTVVTTELKAALMQRIGGKSWLDAATKKRALIKANAIIEQLVYPKKIANNTFLNNLYSSVSCLNSYCNDKIVKFIFNLIFVQVYQAFLYVCVCVCVWEFYLCCSMLCLHSTTTLQMP